MPSQMDIAINEVCKAAELFLSDAVIITGTSTGSPACHTQVMEAKQACYTTHYYWFRNHTRKYFSL